ncbi:MAG: apolipoprotein N-acyltransferase [Alphaproteobacteria bacterium]|nr:apolipoprotein N-acyltransferase [Alphaproteobacteria bacterium]
MQVCVNIENNKWKKYKIDFEKIANAAISAVYKDSEVSITLVDDKQIHKLNKQYRGIDKPTNVLSFELGDDLLLGDIFISLDTVMREAKDANISVEEHTAHMIVHGILHLQGYDHLNDKEAKVMENKEIRILKNLGYKNPYAEEDVVCNSESCCPGSFITKLKSIKIQGFWIYLLSVFLGAITAFGFAPFHLWLLSVLGIGGMYYLTIIQKNKINFWKSWLFAFPFGATYGTVMFWWVLNSIYVIPELARQFAVWTLPGLIGIALICGIILSVPFAVIRYVSRKTAQRAVLFATIWTLVLWGREWFLTGFPWNPLSNILINVPMVANSMSLWGAIGLTFVIVGLISSFVELITNKTDKSCKFIFAIYIILFVVGCVFGYRNMKISDNYNIDNMPLIRIVQPAQSAVYKMPTSKQEAQEIAKQKIRDLFVWATNDKSAVPDIIVFPETAYPYTVVDDDFPLSHILNSKVIMGANHYKDGNLYNSMLIANEQGKIQHLYSKSHLVPFGEYRPFGDVIPTPGLLTPGNGPELISVKTNKNDFVFVPAICYEIVFSDSLVPRDTNPDAIVNITNDTWFGLTPGVYQHLDMVRRYAIESGLPVVRANYSGISAFVMPDGQVESYLSVAQTGSLDGYVWGKHITPYRTIGRDLWMIFILMFSIFVSISIHGFQKKD